jgi:HSP20 family molecular chaperone IbpA
VRKRALAALQLQVHRSYVLPDDVDVKSLASHLTEKGLLSITANKNK